MALLEDVGANPGLSFQLENRRYPGQTAYDPSTPHNPDLPYECSPVLFKEDGVQAVKGNSAGGKTSMFPDSWDEERILDEVEYALAHNEGLEWNQVLSILKACQDRQILLKFVSV